MSIIMLLSICLHLYVHVIFFDSLQLLNEETSFLYSIVALLLIVLCTFILCTYFYNSYNCYEYYIKKLAKPMQILSCTSSCTIFSCNNHGRSIVLLSCQLLLISNNMISNCSLQLFCEGT
jgi:hypothetical protein